MPGWFRGQAPTAVAIDAGLWARASAPWLFTRGLSADDGTRLRALCEQFLARKHFSATLGLGLTEEM